MTDKNRRDGYIYNIREALLSGEIRDYKHRQDVSVLLDALDEANGRLINIEMTHRAQQQGVWHSVGENAWAMPFGTIRKCLDCGCLVAGGPTRCGRCCDGRGSLLL